MSVPHTIRKTLTWLIICCLVFSGSAKAQPAKLQVEFSASGIVLQLGGGQNAAPQKIVLSNTLGQCHEIGAAKKQRINRREYRIEKTLEQLHDQSRYSMVERFTQTTYGLHVTLELTALEHDGGTSIITSLQIPQDKGAARIWTAWSAPPEAIGKAQSNDEWTDPLQPASIANATYYYGAPPFESNHTGESFIPFQNDLFCLPMITAFPAKAKSGITLALSPRDQLIDLVLHLQENGSIQMERRYNRISTARALTLSYDIVLHEPRWQGGIAWMTTHYPDFFKPVNPLANAMAGTAAYAAYAKESLDFDTARMKKMAFSVNWQASFDFPYMGLFLPPLQGDEKWKRYGGGEISVNEMNRYAQAYRNKGCYVLNYFNVTEFGAAIQFPPKKEPATPGQPVWLDPTRYLYASFPDAILPRTTKSITDRTLQASGLAVPYFTWGDGIAMDCGDSSYRRFLLQQLKRHIREIPSASGICIDRLDWLRMINEKADDGITWFEGRPARSLISSWKRILPEIAGELHQANKVLFVNNHTKRIDLLQGVDGIFDEFTYSGAALNLTAFLCLSKTALGWTDNAETIRRQGGDHFFQKYLYMGVFPMCPFPMNDHSITTSQDMDQYYLDYGPLLSKLKGKEWVLDAGLVTIQKQAAAINLFKVQEGYAIPIVYGKEKNITLDLQANDHWKPSLECLVYYPGDENPLPMKLQKKGNHYQLTVCLKRNCALVLLPNP